MAELNHENIKNQVGCGYCEKETTCQKRNPKINKAKLGCPEFKHFSKSIKK